MRVVGVPPRITRRGFREILERYGSPAATEAVTAYDAIMAEGVDPLFLLAVFWHESHFGTRGIVAQYGTKNPGNTRRSSTGIGTVIQTEKGRFVSYPSWTEGFRDAAHRLVDQRFPYAQRGATTVQEIIPIWAPREDGNDPDSYVRSVLRFMEEYREDVAVENRLPVIESMPSPGSNFTRGRGGKRVLWVIVHTTEGSFTGSVSWLRNPQSRASAHYVVGRDHSSEPVRIAALVDESDTAWTAGNYAVNQGSVNVELVGYARRNPPVDDATLEVGAALVRQICLRHGIPIQRVDRLGILAGVPGIAGHVDVPDPDQPQFGGGDGRHTDPGPFFPWERFLELVSRGDTSSRQDDPMAVIQVGPFGCHLGGGFRRFWEERGGVALFGWPVTEEFTENGVTVQYFERARFEHRPDIGKTEDYHVVLGRVGAEILELREELFALRGAKREQCEHVLEQVAAELSGFVSMLEEAVSELQGVAEAGSRLLVHLERRKEAA